MAALSLHTTLPSLRRTLLFLSLAGACAAAIAAAPARAADDDARTYCKSAGTDDQRFPLTADMVADANKALGTAMPADIAVKQITWRCMDSRVMVCAVGANLHCGRADTQVVATPETSAWCKQNPGASFIPAYVTGRDTIWKWRCDGRKPHIDGPAHTVDKQGFIAENWKALD